METGILHTHHLIVVVYTLFVALNFIVVVAKRRNALLAIKAKTRMIRVIFEILLLGTGIFLMFKSPAGFSNYIVMKCVVLILGIVFFIIGTKKMQAIFMFLSLLCFVYSYLLSTTRDIFLKPEEMRVHEAYLNAPEHSKGKEIYEIACLRCHGFDGKAGYRKAKNLTESPLNEEAIATFIKMGKGVMPSYSYMKEEEIKVLVHYVKSLKEKQYQ